MGDIGPGDFVESLIDFDAWGGFAALAKGDLRRVDRLFCHPGEGEECGECGDGTSGLILTVDRPNDPRLARCICGFKPVHRPSATLIESLKRPAREPVKEPA